MRTFDSNRRTFLLGAAALALPNPAHADEWPSALPRRPADAPKPSDVCFSARFGEPSSLAVAQAYHATRLDWCYSINSAFMNRARGAGLRTLGGTLSSTLPDEPGGTSTNIGRAVTQAGTPIVAPWMKGWGARWGCVNNPDYRAIVRAHARAQLAAGVDYFTVDGASFNSSLAAWGGCYCKWCQEAARAQGANLERDMRTFQTNSTIQFYESMRSSLDAIAGRHVTLAANNQAGAPGYIAYPFGRTDFGMSEIHPAALTPTKLKAINVAAELAGHPQALTLVSSDRDENRRAAAWCYATGGNMIVPWDVWQRNGPRFYGEPAEFADVFQLARQLGSLLDNAAPAPQPPDGAWSHGAPGMAASLRGDPARSFAMLHLVAWGNEEPGELRVDATKVIPGRRVALARVWSSRGPIPMALSGDQFAANVPAATWLAVELRT